MISNPFGGSCTKVRGLGVQQQEQKKFTESKIVAYLTVRPLTSEELFKISKIHKATLFARLSNLITRGILIKHKYAIPFTSRNYPDLYDFKIRPRAKFGHFYYLLNWSNVEARELLDYYCKSKEPTTLLKYKNDKELSREGYSKKDIARLDEVNEPYINELESIEEKQLQVKMKVVDRILEFAERVAKLLSEGNFTQLKELELSKDPRESAAEIVLRKVRFSKFPSDTKCFLTHALPYLLSDYFRLSPAQLKTMGKDLMKEYITKEMKRNIQVYREKQDCLFLLLDDQNKLPLDNSYLENAEFVKDIQKTVSYFMKSTGSIFDAIIRLTTDTVNEMCGLPSLDYIHSHIQLWEVLKDKRVL